MGRQRQHTGEGSSLTPPRPKRSRGDGGRLTEEAGALLWLDTLLADQSIGWALDQWGFDTVTFRFALESRRARASLHAPFTPDAAADATATIWTDGTLRVDAGTFDPDTALPLPATVRANRSWFIELPYAQVHGYPDSEILTVQCRPSALLARDDTVRELFPPRRIEEAATAAASLAAGVLGMEDLGRHTTFVRRADLAADFRNLADSAMRKQRGADLLLAVATVVLPRCRDAQRHPHREPGRLEGVTFQTRGSHVNNRWYDSGDLREHARVGEVVRYERQWRPTSTPKIPTLEEFAVSDFRHMFLGAWGAWMKDELDRGCVVCGKETAAKLIADMYTAGVLSRQSAVSRLGVLTALDARVGDQIWEKPAARKDALSRLRRLGIAFDPVLPAHVSVRVGALLALAAAEWPTSR